MQPGCRRSVASDGGELQGLLAESDGLAGLVRLRSQAGEGDQEIDLLGGLAQAAIEVEGATEALASPRRLAAGDVDPAEQRQQVGLELGVVEPARHAESVAEGTDGILGLVEPPEG